MLFRSVVYRRLSLLVALAMLGALLLVGLPAIPMCIQFSTTFYIAMLSVLAVLLWPGLTRERGDAYITFFTIGALTAFFDFLTTPQVTLGFPLVVCLLLRKPWRTVRDVVLFLLSWFSGYASLWVSKCLLAQLLTTHDVIGNFLQLVRVRTIAGTGTLVPFLSDRWGEERAFQLISLLCVLIALFLLLVIYAWHRLSRNPQVRRQRWLLVIALIPPVSYVLTLQHAVIHYWFVWRALSVTFLCVFLFAYFITHSSHEQDRRTHSLL